MDTSTLLELCEPWTSEDGEVQLMVLPFTTYRANAIHKVFIEIVPKAQWFNAELAFMMFSIYVIDLKITAEKPKPMERFIQKVWDMQDAPMEERWEYFNEYFTEKFGEWMSAVFANTRDHTFDAPKPLQVIPKATASGEPKRSTRSQRKTS